MTDHSPECDRSKHVDGKPRTEIQNSVLQGKSAFFLFLSFQSVQWPHFNLQCSHKLLLPPMYTVLSALAVPNCVSVSCPCLNEVKSGLTMLLSRHSVETYPETCSHATCQGTLGHSCLSSLSLCGLILA